MTEKEQLARDLQEFRELWGKLSQQGKEKAAAALLAVVLEETRCSAAESHGEEPVSPKLG